MKYTLQSLEKEERKLLFALEKDDPWQKRKIGHVRGDFGSSGKGFFHTWWPCCEKLNIKQFKSELQEVVDELRSDSCGLLQDRRRMREYCCNAAADIVPQIWNDETFGFKVVTEHYRYYLRCYYGSGDYNFYIHCYVNELFD